MGDYTDSDRDRAIDTNTRVGELVAKVARLETGQRVSLRRIRRLPDLTATAIVQAVSRRALILVGVGIALGSALGGAGIELVRKIIATVWGGH